MSSILEFDSTQLTAARAKAWHQNGEGILTLEAAREWIAERGIVLFAPRSAQLPAPAPSLVEATLGVANDAPTAAETSAARNLLARMVADGVALPLNLLGVPGDVPDFVVSAQVFSYVFTLRGDKAWKQPPATSGAIAVSPLGLHIYELLASSEKGRGAMTAAELATELGREVTETAILRGLSELWSQLRVLPLLAPVPQDGGTGATMWELTTRRFTKAIKAGANAGVPTALSALISLYLAQAITASEDEVATFLSPLTARSRVREVLRALISSRQLETLAVDGKTLLHIPGTLPEFQGVVDAPMEGAAEDVEFEAGDAPVLPKPKKIGTGRISSFTSETKTQGEFRGKPVKSFRTGAKTPGKFGAKAGARAGAKPASKYGPRLDGKSDPERRPFKKAAGVGAGFAKKPTFTKPWDEEKKPRVEAAPDAFTKFRKPAKEDRPPLGRREQAGLPEERRTPKRESFDRAPRAAKTFDGKPAARKPFAAKTGVRSSPSFGAKPGFGAKPSFGAKKAYTPRTSEDGERPAFKPRSYEGAGKTFEKKPYERKPYERKANAGKTSFPGKPAFGAKRAYTPRATEDGDRPAFKPRAAGAKTFEKKPYERKPFAGKAGFGEKRPYSPRKTEGGSYAKAGAAKPFAKRAYAPKFEDAGPAEGSTVERTLPKRPHKPRAADAHKRPFNKDPWVPPTDGGEGKRPYKARGAGGAKKPFGARKPFGAKAGGAKGFSSSARPAGRKKPGA